MDLLREYKAEQDEERITITTTTSIYCHVFNQAQARQVKRSLRYSISTSPMTTKDSPKLYKGQVTDKPYFRYKRETRKRRYYAVSEAVEWWPVRELKKSRAFRQLLVKCENGCISAIFEASLLASSSDFKRFSVPISGK